MHNPRLALVNGEILTMDPHHPRVEALLIENGRIAEVGNSREILNCAGRERRLVDLAGRVVTPGFIDSHTHFVASGLDLSRPDLSGAGSLDEVLEIVREALRSAVAPHPLIAVNWDQSKWKDPHIPVADELEEATKGYPVILRRVCGHIAVANRAALRLLPRSTEKVDWRKGLLFEDAALNLNSLWPPDTEQVEEGLVKAMDWALRIGVTSIHDIASLRYYRIYARLERMGKLKLRVYICFKCKDMDRVLKLKISRGDGNEWLRAGGIKIFADGSLGAQTAALHRPYRASPGRGALNFTPGDLLETMRRADENGYQLFVHAIGDRCIEQVLRAYEALLRDGNPARHRIEHFEIATRAQIEKLRRLKLIAAMQPNFVIWQQPGGLYERILGLRRARMANRIGDVLKAGINAAFGSDSMPFNPFQGLWGAVAHPRREQRISVEEAIRGYTLSAAYAGFDEEVKGSLIPGKLADLVVLSTNPFNSRDLRKTEVLLTVINGEIAYSASDHPLGLERKS